MSRDDENRLRIRPGAPRQRADAFVGKVLRQAGKAGSSLDKALSRKGNRPGARLGRGHVAARFAGHGLGPGARRVTIKARLVNLRRAGPSSMSTHLRYIEREGVDRQGGSGQAYGALRDTADLEAFKERCTGDRHQFRFIVSPEDAGQVYDLRTYTRHLMGRMETDLGTRLDWVAVDHWNTDNPHTHIVLRGKDQAGKDLVIAGDYIAQGMRGRAAELATRWLGPRTEREIQLSMQQQVDQRRWTGLDLILQRNAQRGLITHQTLADPRLQSHRQVLIGRLQRLQEMKLATGLGPGQWSISPEAESVLRAMGERGDIVRTMQRAMGNQPRELSVFTPGSDEPAIVGRVASKGLVDELYEKGYLVVDGADGRAHYVTLPPRAQLEQFPSGAVVEVRTSSPARGADLAIAAGAVNGVYNSNEHLAAVLSDQRPDQHQQVAGYVHRLEALRRAGIVERMADGVWHLPPDLPEQGQQYDQARLDGAAAIVVKSHFPIEKQVGALGATWLDQQLINGGKGLANVGFGAQVQDAMAQRAQVLVGHGLATFRRGQLHLAPNVLRTLRERELDAAAARLSAQSGLEYRKAGDGVRVVGVYRRNLTLASGRYVMLDDGMGFSLVPWKPVIDARMGQTLSATVRGSGVSWDLSRERGPSL